MWVTSMLVWFLHCSIDPKPCCDFSEETLAREMVTLGTVATLFAGGGLWRYSTQVLWAASYPPEPAPGRRVCLHAHECSI